MHFLKRPAAALIEVMIGVGLMAVVTTTLFSLYASEIFNYQQSSGAEGAVQYAQEGLAAARAIRDRAWDELATGTHGVLMSTGTWRFSGTSDTRDGYVRRVSVEEGDDDQKIVTAVVSWTPVGRSAKFATSVAMFSNWRNAKPAIVWGTWSPPRSAASIDFGAGVSGRGLAVKNHIVYAVGDASDPKKPDFFVINATDVFNPYVMATLDTGKGLSAVAVSGTRVYATTVKDAERMQVINISNPSNPSVTYRMNISNALTTPVRIEICNNRAYVGAMADGKPDFGIIDISSPDAPTLKSTMTLGGDVRGISCLGQYVYLATSKDDAEVMVIDATNATSPTLVKSINLPGTGNANDIFINPKRRRTYVARDVDSTSGAYELTTLNTSYYNNPVVLGGANASDNFLRVIEDNRIMFVSVQNSNAEFQVFDAWNPITPTLWSTLNYPQDATDMDFEDNDVYVTVRSNDALRILTSQ